MLETPRERRMTMYVIDQKQLLGLHEKLDPLTYSVGKGKGKAKYGEDPSKIKNLDCSGYVHYVLNKVTDGKIVIGKGPSWVNSGGIRDWAKKQGLTSVDYAKNAGKNDNILRLAYLPPSKSYGHIWMILNGETLESHGGQGVNRRAWDTAVLKKNATDCFEIAQTTTVGPAKYRLAGRCEDPEIRKLLDAAIDNDQRISYAELSEILLSISSNGISMQELKDLQTIADYSLSLDADSKALLSTFIRLGPALFGEEKAPAPAPSADASSKQASQKANEELFKNHPELKGRALTNSKADAALRKEWIQLYRKHGGT
jgi:hypothetical protein